MTSCSNRRTWLKHSAAATGAALASPTVLAQHLRIDSTPDAAPSAEVLRLSDAFTRGATPLTEGLVLDLPDLGDNPASVPVKVRVTLPITEQVYCESMIVMAEVNPFPLASTFHFTPAMGTAEVAMRIRMSGSQHVRALARMSDGRVLLARQFIEVAPGSCGL